MARKSLLPGLAALLYVLAGAAVPHASAATRSAITASSDASLTMATQDQQETKMAGQDPSAKPKTKKLGIVLFDGFETLDVFGPVEMWSRLADYELVVVSQDGKPVRSAQGIETVARYSFESAPQFEILMVPGGMGSRTQVDNPAMLDFIRRQDRGTQWTISVCTGSALLAKAGLLDSRKATTNKLAYKWATGQSAKVKWQPRARWVVDGKYITSSGVSAGTDMALAVVEKLDGRKAAEEMAKIAEYSWDDDPANDPFAVK